MRRRLPTLVLVAPFAAACVGSGRVVQSPTASAAPRVTIDAGTLEGAIDPATGVQVYRAIPYAAPPLGRLRWAPPASAASWSGMRPADKIGRNCMQRPVWSDIDPLAAGVSEDCLFLNVWSTGTRGAARPVMVWIHGGGFFAGFGGEGRHDGGYLAQKGAVVVTLNYRLGVLGFLAHPALAAESPNGSTGNYGLLDQLAALQWVQRNIRRFGGDPGRVTIFGESAGGMSVGALIASPLAKGLFHRAILQSGVGLGGIVAPRDTLLAQGVRFAESLGATGRGAEAAAALRAIPADTLLARLAAMPQGPSSTRPSNQPTLDGWFLPRPLDSALVMGTANLVPVIVGSNADEPDEVFGAPARVFARLVAGRGGRAYLYQFTRVAQEDSVARKRGAYHSADIVFGFGIPRPVDPAAGRAAYDSTLADAMSDYWVSFAASGDPNGPPSAGRRPRWPVYEPQSDAHLELGAEVAVRHGLRKAQYDALDEAARKRGEIRP